MGGLPLLFGLSMGTAQNLLVSFTEASDNKRRYSCLSITTTPDPFRLLVFINFSECWCKIEILTKFQEFDRSIAIYLLSTALFEPPEQMQLIITFEKS